MIHDKRLLVMTQKAQSSYAHQSLLYQYLENKASLKEIVTFLHWDYQQPNFQNFIRLWLKKCPEQCLPSLQKHVDEEEGHGELFSQLMEELYKRVKIDKTVNFEKLNTLNYTFTPLCADKESFGFFTGSFYATEVLSLKRNLQLFNALKRFNFPLNKMHYLELHSVCDLAHSNDVLDVLVFPIIKNSPETYIECMKGLEDRLKRSEEYLKWYEDAILSVSQKNK